MNKAEVAVMLLLFTAISSAANISGSFYSVENLDTYSGSVIVEMKGPQYYKGLFNENYSIVLPDGEYNLTAYSIDRNLVSQEENIILKNSMKWDLVLMYSDPENELDNEINSTIDVVPEAKKEENILLLIIEMAIAMIVVAIVFFIISHKMEKKYDEEQEYIFSNEKTLTQDETKFILTVKNNENVIIQKELRKLLGWSDAKASLISKSMESQGYVKIVKKGRENIIKITEKGKEIIKDQSQLEPDHPQNQDHQ